MIAALLALALTAPPSFVALDDVDPTILQDMRYRTKYNFVGRRIDGYREPVCILERRAARALHHAQDDLRQQRLHAQGLRLLPPAARRRPLRALGGERQPADEARVLSARRQVAAVRRRLHRAPLRPQPRQHRRPHARQAAGEGAAALVAQGVRPRALHGAAPPPVPGQLDRHGHELRLLRHARAHAHARAARARTGCCCATRSTRSASTTTRTSGGTSRCATSATRTGTSTSRSRERCAEGVGATPRAS